MTSETPRTNAKESESAMAADHVRAHYGWKFARQLEHKLAAKEAELENKEHAKQHLLTRAEVAEHLLLQERRKVARLRKTGMQVRKAHFLADAHPFSVALDSLDLQSERDVKVLRLAGRAGRWDGFLEQIDEMGVVVPNELRDLVQAVRGEKA